MKTIKVTILPFLLATQVGMAQTDHPSSLVTRIKEANPISANFNREAYLNDIRSIIKEAEATIPAKRGSRSSAETEKVHCQQVADIPSQKILDDLRTLHQNTSDLMPLLKIQVDIMRLNMECGFVLKL